MVERQLIKHFYTVQVSVLSVIVAVVVVVVVVIVISNK